MSPSGAVYLTAYQIGPVYPSSFVSERDAACLIDGIFLPPREESSHGWPLDWLKEVSAPIGKLADGEFVAVWSRDENLYCHSNIGGSHSLYVTETDEFIAISNRSVCLLGLPGVSDELDPESVRWKAFRGYAYGRATAFSSIRKILNGSWVSADDVGFSVTEPPVTAMALPEIREAFRSNPLAAVDAEIDRISDYMARAYRHSGVEDIDVSLSGGKDSRVILGLTRHADLIPHVKQVWTRGTHYSPEVLAAQDVCAAIGVVDHEVRRPPLFSATYVNAGLVIRSISGHEGMLSLFDVCGITPRKDFRFQGHELGLRAGRFATAPTTDIDTFVKTSIKSWSNPVAVVRDPDRNYGALAGFFHDGYSAGAPVEDLGDLHYMSDRRPAWAAVISILDYCGGKISNPLVEGGVVRFAFSVPAQFRRTEAFHYLALRRTAPEIVNLPFADQSWSAALLSYLEDLGVKGIDPSPRPYKGSKHYPNERNPYVNNVKIDMFDVLKPIVNEMILENRQFFEEMIDVDRFIERQASEKIPNFQYLYAALGIYSAVLMKQYGVAIFDRERQKGVIEDLQGRMDFARGRGFGAVNSLPETLWPDIVERHERAIAGLAREIYSMYQSQPLTSPLVVR